jgi:hypothetical protein
MTDPSDNCSRDLTNFDQPFKIGQQSPLGLAVPILDYDGSVICSDQGVSCVRIRTVEVCSCLDDPLGEYPSGLGVAGSTARCSRRLGRTSNALCGGAISGLLPSLTG